MAPSQQLVFSKKNSTKNITPLQDLEQGNALAAAGHYTMYTGCRFRGSCCNALAARALSGIMNKVHQYGQSSCLLVSLACIQQAKQSLKAWGTQYTSLGHSMVEKYFQHQAHSTQECNEQLLFCQVTMRKKNPVNQNQGLEPIQQKYKANENTSRHNLKRKQKQTINKNQVKPLCKEDS